MNGMCTSSAATSRRLPRWSAASSVALLALASLAACGGDDNSSDGGDGNDDQGVVVTDAYTIKPVDGQPVAGVFANVANNTDDTITIVGATSPVSDDVQLHITVEEDGAMTMQQTDQFEVNPGETFVFERGGPHIMLMDIDAATYPATDVEVTLELADGEEVPFEAEVTELGESDG